jgi:hypothetical protein
MPLASSDKSQEVYAEAVVALQISWKVTAMDVPDPQEIGDEAEFVDDATDDDEVSPSEQLLLDRKELHESGLELDNPEGLADD